MLSLASCIDIMLLRKMDFAVVDMMTIFAIFNYVTFLWNFASAFMFLQASHTKFVSYN